jgi:hypothetical protein
VTLIELGEPTRYDPGRAPLLGRNRVAVRPLLKTALAALVIATAGGLAGTAPAAAALPQVHHVGRFPENSSLIVGDLAVSTSPDERTVLVSALDGSGPRWQRSFPDRVVGSMGRAGDVLVIAVRAADEPPSASMVLAVDPRTGGEFWHHDGWSLTELYGGPVLVLQVGSGASDDPLIGVDVASGREVWRRDVPSGGAAIVVERAAGRPEELLIVAADGAIQPIRIGSGEAAAVQRTDSPGPVLFAWEDLVVRQVDRTTAYAEIVVYRRGQARLLWGMAFTSEFSLWPCGRWFCEHSSAHEVWRDPYTGDVFATDPNGSDPQQSRMLAALGKWQPIGDYADRSLVRLDSGWTVDAKTWLGVTVPTGTTYRVHPLMALGGRVTFCTLTADWLYCAGTMLADTVSVRLSDLDPLLAEVRGTG